MQNAETKRLIFEWLYGVSLYLENDNGIAIVSKYSLGVERETFVLLLEWAMPLLKILDNDIKEELSFWKTRRHDNAWNEFVIGRFLRDDPWDQEHWGNQFNDMREQARACRSQISVLIESQFNINEEGDRLTPVIFVSEDDLEKCLPSERITVKCDHDLEAKARVERYLQSMLLPQNNNKLCSDHLPETIKAIPPPTLHPTNPYMPMVHIPENKAPLFLSTLTVKQDKD